jgi:glycosyltransferase involved in cell wall biosynthesis
VAQKARERGIALLEDDALSPHLAKHLNPLRTLRAARELRRLQDERPADVVHVHLSSDHVAAALSRRKARRPPLLVRSFYGSGGKEQGRGMPMRERWALVRACDGVVAVTRSSREELTRSLGLPGERVLLSEGAVDTQRFDPARADRQTARSRFGLGERHFAVGIAARMQTHRRFEVFLEAIARLSERLDALRVLILGRGTNMHAVAVEPVERMGLARVVQFPGFLEGDDYVDALGALDAGVLMIPGSDGSARAVREMMAMGLPVVVARSGSLPEIVGEGEQIPAGLVFEEGDASGLADALELLARDAARRRALGRAALALARERYSLAVQARAVLDFYRELLAAREIACAGRKSIR